MKRKFLLMLMSMLAVILTGAVYASNNPTKNTAASKPKKHAVSHSNHSKKKRSIHTHKINKNHKALHRKSIHRQRHPSQALPSSQKNTKKELMLVNNSARTKTPIPTTIDQRKILKNAPTMDPQALNYALHGYSWAMRKGHVRNPGVLTLIDFNKPSSARRLWVIDLRNSRVLLNLYTTHGKNSGTNVAQRFSSRVGSDMTSLGVYETLNPYRGGHGLSLKLQGLEQGVNDTAYRRTVVVHPAWYATPSYVQQNHGAGRSWGCFAIDPNISPQLINTIQNGSIIFAYADQEKRDALIA